MQGFGTPLCAPSWGGSHYLPIPPAMPASPTFWWLAALPLPPSTCLWLPKFPFGGASRFGERGTLWGRVLYTHTDPLVAQSQQCAVSLPADPAEAA